MTRDDNDAVIVRTTIDLAHNMGRQVIAEGVESRDAYDLLEILRCDLAQGFYICKPLPESELRHWLIKEQTGDAISCPFPNPA